MTPDSGPVRDIYLAAMKRLRRRLDDTQVLDDWTRRAIERPRTPLAHLRTLLAVHNAEDLVRLDLAWWTYEALSIVEAFLAERPTARVFEYGSGASTVWLARRAASVETVEHDPAWAEEVHRLLNSAPDLRCEPVIHLPNLPRATRPRIASSAPSGAGLDFAHYVATIGRVGGDFDLILIDGRAREACLLAALDRVVEDGIILLDDSHRRRYQPTLRRVANAGWSIHRARGLSPCHPTPRETALISPPARAT